jgi:hypothetical protein
MKFGVQCLIGKVHLSVSVKKQTYNFTLQKAMIFGQTMTIIIITIIKQHNSKHYIYSIFIKTDDHRLCLLYNTAI